MTTAQVLGALGGGLDYEEAARRLGIPPGQAYLVATGIPADGGDSLPEDAGARAGVIAGSTQHLVYAEARPENPTRHQTVNEWLHGLAADDPQMKGAAGKRRQSLLEPGPEPGCGEDAEGGEGPQGDEEQQHDGNHNEEV